MLVLSGASRKPADFETVGGRMYPPVRMRELARRGKQCFGNGPLAT